MKTNILWLHSDRFGCGTYRCYIPALSLEDRGYSSSFLPHVFVKDPLPFHELDEIDICVFQRAVGTAFVDFMDECKRRNIITIFEMDDDLFHVPRHNPASRFWSRPEVQRILVKELYECDKIVVSTQPLADTLIKEQRLSPDKVFVCHNHLHDSIWGPPAIDFQEHANNQEWLVIGWQGSATHEEDFRYIVPALKRIMEEFPQVMFRFVGNMPQCARAVIPTDRFQVTRGVLFDKYPALLKFANFDIGLAPVTDTKLNRCKSNIKWLEYSSLSVPSIASNVYPYANSIVDGETGFLAKTVEDWYQRLKLLIENPAIRKKIGEQAKDEVWRNWGPEHSSFWIQAFRAARQGRYDQWLTERQACHIIPTPMGSQSPTRQLFSSQPEENERKPIPTDGIPA